MELVPPQNAPLGIISMVRSANPIKLTNVRQMARQQPLIAILQTMLLLVRVQRVVYAKLQIAEQATIFRARQLAIFVLKIHLMPVVLIILQPQKIA